MSTKYQPSERANGEVVAVRKVQNHGRVQIPKSIRGLLFIKDGDNVYWVVDVGGSVTLRKSASL